MFEPRERRYLDDARLGRLATADAAGRPHAVPVCFAFADDRLVTPLDEKPKRVELASLRRVRDVRENPRVALLVDHWSEDWDRLGWVQVRGRATVVEAGGPGHAEAAAGLREKYPQYAEHALEARPVIRIEPGTVRSWGTLERPAGADR